MKMKLVKFKENIKLPERKHYNDSGADIYMLEVGEIAPHETRVIPLGFGLEIPDGFNVYIQARTSVAKNGVFINQCAIDAGYKGEIHMILTNTANTVYKWNKGDRLGYLVVTPVIYTDFVTELGDERKAGAFGSTNEVK